MLSNQTFYFLRHGETEWNARGLMQGNTDIPLNDVGRSQASAVREFVRDLDVATVCSSPLSRAHETAQIVSADLDCPISLISDLREFSMGVRDGTPFGDWFLEWRSGSLHIEGAETRADFLKRALGGLNEALENPGPVLVVAHGGLFGAIKHYGDLDDTLQVSNCDLVSMTPSVESDAPWECCYMNKERGVWIDAGEW